MDSTGSITHPVTSSPGTGEGGGARMPSPGVDPRTGRAIPIPDREWADRMAALDRELAEIDSRDDEPHEAALEFLRQIDEGRRIQGRPPAFDGYY